MDSTKLKIKIGNHEFEAEGPAEIVQAQFAAFKELVAQAPQPATRATETEQPEQQAPPKNDALQLDSIMRMEGRVVSLTANAGSMEDAILLVLLGQKVFRNNDGVTGGEIIDGLKVSGHTVDRIDRQVDKIADAGLVIVVGVHRGKRYRLTNQGLKRAQEIARTVIATVA